MYSLYSSLIRMKYRDPVSESLFIFPDRSMWTLLPTASALPSFQGCGALVDFPAGQSVQATSSIDPLILISTSECWASLIIACLDGFPMDLCYSSSVLVSLIIMALLAGVLTSRSSV